MAHHIQNDLFINLGDARRKLNASNDDLHNREVSSPDGQDSRHVSALFVDRKQGRIRFLTVGTGGFLGLGERAFPVPAENVICTEPAEVQVNPTREQVFAEPHDDPGSATLRGQTSWTAYDGDYGSRPSWTKGE